MAVTPFDFPHNKFSLCEERKREKMNDWRNENSLEAIMLNCVLLITLGMKGEGRE